MKKEEKEIHTGRENGRAPPRIGQARSHSLGRVLVHSMKI